VHATEYLGHDAVGLAELVQQGELHPREIVAAAVDRIERLDPTLNAVVHRWFDRAVEQAGGELPDGPLRGVPFLLKDLGAEAAGLPLSGGSRALAGYRPDHDSELVARYRQAGVVLLGRTNTPELGLALSTEPKAHGPTRNPWDPARSPGASSGGSAAAVAAGYVPAAHGSDGGGSIRIPASCCGLFGLLPSRGRNPAHSPGWLGLTREHVLTRSVRDSAAFLDASADSRTALPHPPLGTFRAEAEATPRRLLIAFTRQPLVGNRPQHHDCLHALDEAARLCSELGHELEEVSPHIDGERLVQAYITIVAASTTIEVQRLGRLVSRTGFRGLEPITRFLAAMGVRLAAADLAAALGEAERAARQMERFHSSYDLLLTTTLAEPPFELGAFSLRFVERFGLELVRHLPSRSLYRWIVDSKAGRFIGTIPNTMLFNMTGQPAMSVPLHWNRAGLPIGIQFAAGAAGEPLLFRLAGQLEQARPWSDKRPGIATTAATAG
jgi:amidase